MTPKVTIILHLPERQIQSKNNVEQTLNSILLQTLSDYELFVIKNVSCHSLPKKYSGKISIVQCGSMSYPQSLNAALENSTGDYILYIDNRQNPVFLKRSALELLFLVAKRRSDTGMVYADYELDGGNSINQVRLLKHHSGRVRDNQDYGKVLFFNRSVLEKIGYCDPSVTFNTLYDLRLRISEISDLVHISNKYAGALYQVFADEKQTNVFDYLISEKDQQIEAEKVLTRHLKRIGAYLSPDQMFLNRPQPALQPELAASVIIPVNHRPEFIGAAIRSVWQQTISEIEVIIIVNGGAEDPTIPEVQRFQKGGDLYQPEKQVVRLFISDINNIGFCLNIGVENARGKYYVQLDSDDRLKPDAVEKILESFDSDPTIGMVIGSYEVWEKLNTGEMVRMKEIPVVTHDEWTEENGRNNLLRVNGAGAPRSIPIQLVKNIGYFGMNEEPFTQNYGEDYDMVLRISEHYRIGRIFEPIYEVIRHSGGTDHSIDQETVDRNDEAKDWMRIQAILRRQTGNSKV